MIGHIITRTGTSFELALRSDGAENRFLHLVLGDPRRVTTRRAQNARRALLQLRGGHVPEPVYPLPQITPPTVAPLERHAGAREGQCRAAWRTRMPGRRTAKLEIGRSDSSARLPPSAFELPQFSEAVLSRVPDVAAN